MTHNQSESCRIGVAVDLGSTTIAVECLDEMGKSISSFSFPNPQAGHGADVVTRIKYCMDQPDALQTLGNMVWDALFLELRNRCGIPKDKISHIVISGNSVMQHIARGLSVEGFAAAPFHPVCLSYDTDTIEAADVIYPPGFSAFVGADILCGANYLQLGRSKQYDLLIDLGTNGEMLLINDQQGYATSTACGPVFDHAVTGASYGSETIHAIANCVRHRLIDKTGKIADPFFEKGIRIDKNMTIRQQNVRNFQLAKGAIYAGVICLLETAGICAEQVQQVYISGGLGFYMDMRDCFFVRMLPEFLKGKVTISGNTSLEGAKVVLKSVFQMEDRNLQQLQSDMEVLKQRTKSFDLAGHKQFQENYMKALNF